MKRVFGYMVFCLLMLTGCICSVLETPENGGIDPTLVQVSLTLRADTTVEPYRAVKSLSATSEGDSLDMRCIVEVFKDNIGGELVERRIVGCDPSPDGNPVVTMPLALHAGRYSVVAWLDYVDDGSLADKYYKATALSAIHIPDASSYVGDEERKDAYTGRDELDLTRYYDIWRADMAYEMRLEMPTARIEFVATDYDRLLEKVSNSNGEQHFTKAGVPYTGDVDLSQIQVSVLYAGYFPSGYNAYTGKPNDATLGMSFDATARPLSQAELRLAGDHVFVNGTESAVTVNLQVKDRNGVLLNEVEGLKVPLVRGKLTTIRGEFLTRSISSGIGINPGFDGEFDVVIPD